MDLGPRTCRWRAEQVWGLAWAVDNDACDPALALVLGPESLSPVPCSLGLEAPVPGSRGCAQQ